MTVHQSVRKKAISRQYAGLYQWCHPKAVTRRLCYRKYMEHTFDHAHLYMYGNSVLVKPVYAKV